MLDWLTMVYDLPEHLWEPASRYIEKGWVVSKFCPSTGEYAWTSPCREVKRSDDAQVSVQLSGSRIVISGSPARSLGQPNNVFGSDDLAQCMRAHLRVARRAYPDLALPGPRLWRLTRVDVTHSFAFADLSQVRQALGYLRQFDAGRYRVDGRYGDTVYWSPGSRLRSGKAYAKGPHLQWLVEHRQAQASSEELLLARRLLRLELRLGAQWFREWRKHHKRLSELDLWEQFTAYWGQMIGKVEVAEVSERELIVSAGPTEGQGLAAFRTWCLIKAVGHLAAKDSMPARTWYRHVAIFKAAGLGWGDIATGQVVPFRRRALVLEAPVRSWEEVRRAA